MARFNSSFVNFVPFCSTSSLFNYSGFTFKHLFNSFRLPKIDGRFSR